MKKYLSQFVLIAATSAMISLFVVTLGSVNQEAIMSGVAIAIILISVLSERLIPYRHQWNETDGDFVGDITMFVMIFGVLDSVLKFLSPFLLLMLLGNWSTGMVDLPLWQQAILVGVLIELGAYISHYLHHNNKFLWPLHAMHHSPKRLYTLNNFRFHPLNHIINHLIMIVPALLLGFSAESILAYNAVTMPILLLQHSNIDFKFGWLNVFINTNELHRWHHSNEEIEGNANYGRATVIFDRIFGTYLFPEDKDAPNEIGMFTTSNAYPLARSLMLQLSYPFSRKCCTFSN